MEIKIYTKRVIRGKRGLLKHVQLLVCSSGDFIFFCIDDER